ncbi:hypothetical protein Tco_0340358 [Tanacetum coccineum]
MTTAHARKLASLSNAARYIASSRRTRRDHLNLANLSATPVGTPEHADSHHPTSRARYGYTIYNGAETSTHNGTTGRRQRCYKNSRDEDTSSSAAREQRTAMRAGAECRQDSVQISEIRISQIDLRSEGNRTMHKSIELCDTLSCTDATEQLDNSIVSVMSVTLMTLMSHITLIYGEKRHCSRAVKRDIARYIGWNGRGEIEQTHLKRRGGMIVGYRGV